MIKYMVSRWKITIESVEVIKETEKFVVLARNNAFGTGTRREAKVSDYCRYFDSWGDAHQYHVDRLTGSIAATEAKLKQLKDELSLIEEMVPPSVGTEETK